MRNDKQSVRNYGNGSAVTTSDTAFVQDNNMAVMSFHGGKYTGRSSSYGIVEGFVLADLRFLPSGSGRRKTAPRTGHCRP
jgi:hypothetical protein